MPRAYVPYEPPRAWPAAEEAVIAPMGAAGTLSDSSWRSSCSTQVRRADGSFGSAAVRAVGFALVLVPDESAGDGPAEVSLSPGDGLRFAIWGAGVGAG